MGLLEFLGVRKYPEVKFCSKCRVIEDLCICNEPERFCECGHKLEYVCVTGDWKDYNCIKCHNTYRCKGEVMKYNGNYGFKSPLIKVSMDASSTYYQDDGYV